MSCTTIELIRFSIYPALIRFRAFVSIDLVPAPEKKAARVLNPDKSIVPQSGVAIPPLLIELHTAFLTNKRISIILGNVTDRLLVGEFYGIEVGGPKSSFMM